MRFLYLSPLLLLFNCVASDAMYDPPGGKGFWARKSELATGKSTFYRTAAMFAADSKNAKVYTEIGKKVPPKAAIDGLIAAFENNIVPIEHVWFAKPTDIDRNGKVILLLLDIQDGYDEGSSTGYIAGYFDPYNNYSDAQVSALGKGYHSNEAEMLYLDTYPADINDTSFYATLAHEYQHLLQFGKYFRREQLDPEPTWVDEGLSEIASDLTGYGPQVGRAHTLRTALLYGTSLTKEPDIFGLENYAMSYLYFRYLSDSYGVGAISSVFKNNGTGTEGVSSALQSVDPALTSHCGTLTGVQNPHFACSYRYLWSSLIRAAPGDNAAGATVVFNGASSPALGAGSTDYLINTMNSDFKQELVTSLLYGSYLSAGTTGSLESYGMKLYRNNGTGPQPGFNSCSTNPCGLTAIVGSAYFVIFNHDSNPSVTHAASVVDQVTPVMADLSPVPEFVTERPLIREHWHFQVSPSLREFLE